MNETKYDEWPVWRLWLAWLWSWLMPGNNECQTIGAVIERKTAERRR